MFDEEHAKMKGKGVKVLDMEVESAAAKEESDQGDMFAPAPTTKPAEAGKTKETEKGVELYSLTPPEEADADAEYV